MKRKTIFIVLLTFLVLSSCITETYDMDKLSGEAALSPGIVMKAVKGELVLADVVKPNDTLVFDNELLKLVFAEDSVINFGLHDLYSSFPELTYEETIEIAAINLSYQDTLDIEPGDDIKFKEMMVTGGLVNYSLSSWCSFDFDIEIIVATADDGGQPLSQTVNVPAGTTVTGTIDLSGVLISFDNDPDQPYNRLPLEYNIYVPSTAPLFSPSDSVKISLEMDEPEFDYAIGYFGSHSEQIERDTLDLGTREFFSRLGGSIYITSPSLTVNYRNSFGIPLRIDAALKGMNDAEEVTLDRDPVDVEYPTGTADRDISSSFTVDKSNSSLPELVSMLPWEIEFYGSASINPGGETAEDNIVFGDSRFIADMDVEIPMEFRMNALQLSDTTDNFLRNDDPGEESPLESLEELKFDFYMENGFPMGASVMIELYDSTSMTVLETIDTGNLFTAAPVDAEGRVTGPSTGTVEIEFTADFLDATQEADRIIFTVTFNTTDNGSKDVKIYSDYSIVFSAAVKLKAGISLDFNSEDNK